MNASNHIVRASRSRFAASLVACTLLFGPFACEGNEEHDAPDPAVAAHAEGHAPAAAPATATPGAE